LTQVTLSGFQTTDASYLWNCFPCAPGTYSNVSGLAADACSMCPAGTLSPTSEATSCEPCPDGGFCAGAGATSAIFLRFVAAVRQKPTNLGRSRGELADCQTQIIFCLRSSSLPPCSLSLLCTRPDGLPARRAALEAGHWTHECRALLFLPSLIRLPPPHVCA
jgi:hypothetical protein